MKPPKNSLQKGKEAEQKALEFLQKKGYELLSKNYRFGKGEIDLIVAKDNLLVFVEVRSRKNANFGFPEQTISEKKKQLLRKTAENFIFEKNWQKNFRFDIVAVLGEQIEHFEDTIF
ncbi:MAG: YraN family protein [Raineya sp.]